MCAQHVESLQLKLSSEMKLLRKMVQSKTAVPTAVVFVSAFAGMFVSVNTTRLIHRLNIRMDM